MSQNQQSVLSNCSRGCSLFPPLGFRTAAEFCNAHGFDLCGHGFLRRGGTMLLLTLQSPLHIFNITGRHGCGHIAWPGS